MINLQREVIGEIQLLHMVKEEIADKTLPTVIYYHGFNGEKESSLTPAYKMVEKGLRVILPDSQYHGDKEGGIHPREKEVAFWEIVFKNIKELKQIKDSFVKKGLTDATRIGVGGTSMGGITTYIALAQYEWIKAGAVLMGTPNITQYGQQLIERFNASHKEKLAEKDVENTLQRLQQVDLSLHPEKLEQRPLFIWHGVEDNVVPVSLTDEFYEKVIKSYHSNEKLSYLREENRMHHLSKLSMVSAAEWFEKHLS